MEASGGRPLSFAIIGGGMAGILAAIKLQEAGYDEVTLYEKADRLGGTWRENTYPGIACDVPSHLYRYSFEANPEWTQRFAPGEEIQAYLEGVAAKHGVVGLTKTVALEAAEFGVTCNAICPGYVKTPLVVKQIPDTARERGITEDEVVNEVMLKPQPTKRFIEIGEVASLAVFLCSEKASSITGAALQIDGG